MKALIAPISFLLASLPALLLGQVPEGFDFAPTPSSATVYGQAQIDGVPCASGDWVAAFDATGICAGASPLFLYNGVAYINLQVYGNDITTAADEGIDPNEAFSLRLYDASEDTVLVYQSPLNPVTFEGWTNTNGAPLPGMDDENAMFDWITVDVGFDVPISSRCLQGEPIDLGDYAYPQDGVLDGPGVVDGVFSPVLAGLGVHVLSFTYSLATVYDTIEVYDFAVTLNGSNPLCFGDNTGSISAVANGGFGSISFEYSTTSPSSLFAGDHSVVGTDELGCLATDEVSLVNPPQLNLEASVTDALCAGDDSGSASVVTEGGSGNVALNWMGSNPTALAAGTYQVTATDDNGCTASTSFDVNEPAALASEVTVASVLCEGGSSGSVALETTGGTPPYSTDWGGQDPAALLEGEYIVIVQDDNGCALDLLVEVSEPTGMALSVETVDVLCHGEASGAASLTVQGGTEPYAIDWQGAAPESLAAGVYTVVVIDNNACEASLSFNIVEPDPLAIDLTTSDVNCAGEATGTVEVSLSGGAGDLTWHVDASDVTSLPAGNYTVTATDANNCSSSEDFTISQNPTLQGSFTTLDVTCHGDGDGFAAFTPQGGLPPYDLHWIGVDPNALSGGLHHVEVTDDAGCSNLFSVQIHEPLPLELVAVATRARCIDGTGSVGFEATGGSGTYIVDWDGLNLNATPIGTHNYTVSDTNGCTSQGSVTVYPSVGECGCTEPSAVNFDAEATENDGSCVFAGDCPADLDGNQSIGLGDLLIVLSEFGLPCQ